VACSLEVVMHDEMNNKILAMDCIGPYKIETKKFGDRYRTTVDGGGIEPFLFDASSNLEEVSVLIHQIAVCWAMSKEIIGRKFEE
jgi:hypothetical protein